MHLSCIWKWDSIQTELYLDHWSAWLLLCISEHYHNETDNKYNRLIQKASSSQSKSKAFLNIQNTKGLLYNCVNNKSFYSKSNFAEKWHNASGTEVAFCSVPLALNKKQVLINAWFDSSFCKCIISLLIVPIKQKKK